MKYDPAKHHRRSIRLKGYDYTSPGAYFITICTHQRRCLFGNILDKTMKLSGIGLLAQACWQRLPHHCPNVTLDEFIVMPNHIHGILFLDNGSFRDLAPAQGVLEGSKEPQLNAMSQQTPKSGSLGAIIRSFKSVTSRRIGQFRDPPDCPVWQRNFYEHIIRNEAALHQIRHYIQTNPQFWQDDRLHPQNPGV